MEPTGITDMGEGLVGTTMGPLFCHLEDHPIGLIEGRIVLSRGSSRPDTLSCQTGHMSAESAAPAGFHSVTPRIVVSDAAAAVAFLRAVFNATGDGASDRPAEMHIGDSVVLVSEAGEREVFPAFLYVYVDDADTTYQRALGAGAASVEKPWDTPYGDRRAMVRDTCGNLFQVANRI